MVVVGGREAWDCLATRTRTLTFLLDLETKDIEVLKPSEFLQLIGWRRRTISSHDRSLTTLIHSRPTDSDGL